MSDQHKCSTMKGSLRDVLLFIFFGLLVMAGAGLFVIMYELDPRVMMFVLGAVMVGFLVALGISQRKYSSSALEVGEMEIKFFDGSGRHKFSLAFDEIVSVKPEHFSPEFPIKIIVRRKDNSIFSIFTTEEAYQSIEEKLRNRPVLDNKGLQKIPMFMHFLFVFFVLIFILLGYAHIIEKKPYKFREIWYGLIGFGFIIYYVTLTHKLRNKENDN
ncbi:MAG: hypothetical protein N2050_03200 [Flavobacteriales bacterium]|nr:hypothetical protein [Flavobacteriales bacterium]